jgi:UDP-N-acetylglucosamine 2-epimerase (non-hydrolysing)
MRKSKKLGIIYGTRPEIIKLSPIIHLCVKRKIPFFTIHTGQHYSFDMDRIFFKDLGLPAPDYKLCIRSKAPYMQGDHTGRMLIEIEKVLLKEMPYCVVVQGDTNTAFAGALTAEKISTTESYTGFHIKVAHVEAGLRSYDRSMPEETNRFITDHISDFLFTPTQQEKKILLTEGIPPSYVHVTGNTIVDAVMQYRDIAEKKSRILKKLGLKRGMYALVTLHRQENVDSAIMLNDIIRGFSLVYNFLHIPLVFPAHPRTVKMLKRFGISIPGFIKVIEPLGFMDFLKLQANSLMVLTDSGGLQEEACTLKIPCITIRDNTERPETVTVGANIIAGRKPEVILKAAKKMMMKRRNWKNPLGNGHASDKILKVLMS